MMKNNLQIASNSVPKVLLIGNGLLQLAGGGNWDKLLQKITTRDVENSSLSGVPYAMRPEVLCGVDVEEVQRKTATELEESNIHPLLKKLLELPFDAIITTNYTYEIETALLQKKWSEYQRQRSICVLHGSNSVRDNTCMCNFVKTPSGKEIPVFHVHGEKSRKHSLVLSYYSYAKSVAKLHALNKERANQYYEKQAESKEIDVWSWLDYFILGDVYTLGFGFDLSEFDIWWALERKAREIANHGKAYLCMITHKDAQLPQVSLADAFDAEILRFDVDKDYLPSYEQAVKVIEKIMGEREKQNEQRFCD